MFRLMQYDGQTLQYPSDKGKSQSQKSVPIPGKKLPEKER
jgi:hypothetical protein